MLSRRRMYFRPISILILITFVFQQSAYGNIPSYNLYDKLATGQIAQDPKNERDVSRFIIQTIRQMRGQGAPDAQIAAQLNEWLADPDNTGIGNIVQNITLGENGIFEVVLVGNERFFIDSNSRILTTAPDYTVAAHQVAQDDQIETAEHTNIDGRGIGLVGEIAGELNAVSPGLGERVRELLTRTNIHGRTWIGYVGGIEGFDGHAGGQGVHINAAYMDENYRDAQGRDLRGILRHEILGYFFPYRHERIEGIESDLQGHAEEIQVARIKVVEDRTEEDERDLAMAEFQGPAKIDLTVTADKEDMSHQAAQMVLADYRQAIQERGYYVLGLATGSTPIRTYQLLVEFAKQGLMDWSKIRTFNMDEYEGLRTEHIGNMTPQNPGDPDISYRAFMYHHLFRPLFEAGLMTQEQIDTNINIFSSNPENADEMTTAYERRIVEIGGVDTWIGGIGSDGHIAFNEPKGTVMRNGQEVEVDSATTPDCVSRRVYLTQSTVDDNCRNFEFIDGESSKGRRWVKEEAGELISVKPGTEGAIREITHEEALAMVPRTAFSIGVQTYKNARHQIVMANGEGKADAVLAGVEGEPDNDCALSLLQGLPNCSLALDQAAASKLTGPSSGIDLGATADGGEEEAAEPAVFIELCRELEETHPEGRKAMSEQCRQIASGETVRAEIYAFPFLGPQGEEISGRTLVYVIAPNRTGLLGAVGKIFADKRFAIPSMEAPEQRENWQNVSIVKLLVEGNLQQVEEARIREEVIMGLTGPIAVTTTRPSSTVSPYLTSALIETNTAQEVNRQKLAQLNQQNVVLPDDTSTIFIGRDVDINGFIDGEILPGTIVTGASKIERGVVLEEGSTIHDSIIQMGARVMTGSLVVNSTLGPNALIGGYHDEEGELIPARAIVENVAVGEKAEIAGSLVDTYDFNPEDPQVWGYDSHHRVVESQTGIGENCKIYGQVRVTNTTVGPYSNLDDGSYLASNIGSDNRLGRSKVNLVYTGSNVEFDPKYTNGTQAMCEHQERWVGDELKYPYAECYGEGLVENIIVTPDGPFYVALGHLEGKTVVYSSFSGNGASDGKDIVASLKDRPIVSSSHAFERLLGLSWVGHRTNIIGLFRNPSVTNLSEPNVTDVLPASIVANESSVWGGLMFGKRTGQGWDQLDPEFSVKTSPNFLAKRIMGALAYLKENGDKVRESLKRRKDALIAQGIPEEELGYLECKDFLNDWVDNEGHRRGLVPGILRAMIEVIDGMLTAANKKDIPPLSPVTVKILNDTKLLCERHINSKLWQIKNGELVNWERVSGSDEVRLTTAALEIFSAQTDLIGPVSNWTSITSFYEGYEDPSDDDPYKTPTIDEETMRTLSEAKGKNIPERFRGRKDIVFLGDGIDIGDDVEIGEGTEDNPTIIGPGVILRGNTVVKAGAKLSMTLGENATFGENGRFKFVKAVSEKGRIDFKADCQFYFSSFEAKRSNNIRIGKEVNGDHATVISNVRNTAIGAGTSLFPGATLENSNLEAKCKIGCMVKNSNLGTGFTAQHLATRIYNTDAPDMDVANASNVAAGAIVGKEGGKRVVLCPSVFIGTHSTVEEGFYIKDGCFIVGDLTMNKAQEMGNKLKKPHLEPFALYLRGELRSTGVLSNEHMGLSFIGRFCFGYPTRYANAAKPQQKTAVYLRVEKKLVELARSILADIHKRAKVIPGALGKLVSVESNLEAALAFLSNDLTGMEIPDLRERTAKRKELFEAVRSAIYEAGHTKLPGEAIALGRLQVVCDNLSDGRFRMREGELTDVAWFNRSEEKNNSKLEAVSLVSLQKEDIDQLRGKARIGKELFLEEDKGNTESLITLLKADNVRKIAPEKVGLIISARFIMENAGVREALERFAEAPTRFVVLVDAETDAEKAVIEDIGLPLVEKAKIVVQGAEVGKAERVRNLEVNLGERGVTNKQNIGLIENASENAQEAAAALEAIIPDIYIGVPQAVSENQLISVHGVFHGVVEAIADRKTKRVFSIMLPPLERPAVKRLDQAHEEYQKAIRVLKIFEGAA